MRTLTSVLLVVLLAACAGPAPAAPAPQSGQQTGGNVPAASAPASAIPGSTSAPLPSDRPSTVTTAPTSRESLPTAKTAQELADRLPCDGQRPGADQLRDLIKASSVILCTWQGRPISVVVFPDHQTTISGVRTLHDIADQLSGKPGTLDWRCYGDNWSVGDDNTAYDNQKGVAEGICAVLKGRPMTTQDYLARG